MSTPGHTPESISVLVFEHSSDEVAYGVFTGDALFIGDVGRPDLLASVGVTADELGRLLYDSIQHKLMGLPDAVRVFPAHGAGSACGKNLSTERQSTIGEQRATNYACQPMSQEAFLEVVTEGQPAAPGYFLFNATLNKQDREIRPLDAVVPALSPGEVVDAVAAGALVHDARDVQTFATGHLRGAINVPADGRMAETVGMVFTPDQRIVVIAPEGVEQDVATRFARIGYDGVLGYVAEPEAFLLARQDEVTQASRLTVPEMESALGAALVHRGSATPERSRRMIPGHPHSLAQLATGKRTDASAPVAHCAGGWRSSVGSKPAAGQGLHRRPDRRLGEGDRGHA